MPADLDAVLLAHIQGNQAPIAQVRLRRNGREEVVAGRFRLGAYGPAPDGTTKWLCIDFDGPGHAHALEDPGEAAISAWRAFAAAGLTAHLELSGGGSGWHLWVFFDPPLPAADAQAIGRALAPRDAPLAEGGRAEPRSGFGIEVFPKQTSVRSGGLGNMVWLPWWSEAMAGANQFYRVDANGEIEPYAPADLPPAAPGAVQRFLAMLAAQKLVSQATAKARAAAMPDPLPGPSTPIDWSGWRGRALAALPLHAVYGEWLTGGSSGPGWLECRDPASPTGDRSPSAGVADGTGEAERGSFHSFLSGKTLSVFDFLVQHGSTADFRAARRRVADLSGVPEPLSGPHSRKAKSSEDREQLPEIYSSGRHLKTIVAEAWEATLAANAPTPKVFLHAGSIARITALRGSPEIARMTETGMYGHLARVAAWIRETKQGPVPTTPFRDAARDMIEYPDVRLPPLDGIITTPTFTADGELVSSPGYSASGHLWYEPSPAFRLPQVSVEPSPREVEDAKALLFGELLIDFPFQDPASRAHMLAAIILPFARRLVAGPSPLHLVEAPTEGSGKGLLVNVIAVIATGSPACGGSLPRDDDEIRKKIGAELSTGKPLIFLDNADPRTPIDSPALASATTMWPYWTDRVLGRTEMFTVPNQAVWILTGNNPRLSRELIRRCVSIRIDARVDQPWLRTGFRHPDLIGWAVKHRAELVGAVLLLVRNWIACGRPESDRAMGTFERWSGVIGGILAAAGVEGFLANREKVFAAADAEGNMWRDFVAGWWEAAGDEPLRVGELLEVCTKCDFLAPVVGDGTERSQHTRLGKALQGARDRVFGGFRIEFAGRDSASKRPLYRLVPTK